MRCASAFSILEKVKRLSVSVPTLFHKHTTKPVGRVLLSIHAYPLLRILYLSRRATACSRGTTRILAQEKGVFNQEMEYIFSDQEKFSLFHLNRILTKTICNMAFAQKVNQHNYQQLRLDNIRRSKHEQMIAKLVAKQRYDFIVTFNFGDGETGALIEASKGEIRSICIHKEGVMSPGLMETYSKLLRQRREPFRGDLLLVYNEDIKQALLSTGDYSNHMIHVVGAPRFDIIHSIAKIEVAPRDHHFLMFYPSREAQLNSLIDEHSDFSWDNLCAEFEKMVTRIASAYPTVPLIVKAKLRDVQTIGGGLTDYPNVKITSTRASIDLIKETSLCFGFNSTALVESASLGIVTINCCFGEARDAKNKPWLIDFGSLVASVNTPEACMKIAKDVMTKPPNWRPLNADQKMNLERLVGNSDGKSKQRILAFFSKTQITTSKSN